MFFLFFQLLSKNKERRRFDNLKEISSCEFLCFNFISFMQLVEKNEKQTDKKTFYASATFYALSKINLYRQDFFCRFFHIN